MNISQSEFTKKINKSKTNKIGGLNFIMICIISFMYILLVTKLAEVISINYNYESANFVPPNPDTGEFNESEKSEQIVVYVMTIYFIAIIGMIVGYVWFSKTKSKENITPNWIIQWSLSIGGIILLIYTMINYWDYLNDYSKLFLIFMSISGIIYYLYKYY